MFEVNVGALSLYRNDTRRTATARIIEPPAFPGDFPKIATTELDAQGAKVLRVALGQMFPEIVN